MRKQIKNAIYSVFERVLSLFSGPKTAIDRQSWQKDAQSGEFEFHKNNTWRSTDAFTENSALLFKSFGFNENDFEHKVLLDVGAGSKLRTKYFKNSIIYALEPMADNCIAQIPWCDLKDAAQLYSTPAEDYIPELENAVDFVLSVNVLDHCYNFNEIVANLYQYLKPGGLAFLSFDEHFKTNKMHPLILTDEICTQLFQQVGFQLIKKNTGFGPEILPYTNGPTYGHGLKCLNYWLTKK